MRKKLVIGALLAVSLTACGNSSEEKVDNVHTGELFSLEILGFDGERIGSFHIEILDSDAERAQGFMYRTEMANDKGMLFIWEQPKHYMMWMKNTNLPLDMLFIRDDIVLDIALGAIPHSEARVGGTVSVDKILELPAGRVEALGIQVGHTVRYSR